MKLCLVVAAAQNNVIGVDNELPWHLPEDLKYFKRITMGKPIVMGRKTFESIGRPLPGRHNIVITRQHNWQREGVTVVHDVESAIAAAAAEPNQAELMVIGGAEIYRQALPLAERIYLTRVACELEGDAFFPELAPQQWRQVACEQYAACERNPYDYAFCVLERVTSGDN
ncbi:MAG: type 3 dihydrofolate reductase [Cellvibrionaceae bacterium]|nr:type 3 dihydrofolate reductase [Cellvibrionaceae bacterium]MCV6626742.1 type 3 dihydrofolate reductase [Cellvibrionaceae bacterium]